MYLYTTVLFYCVHNISVDRVGVSSPPTAVTGSPHSQATPGSPVTSSVSSTTTTTTVENVAVKTPPTHHSPGEQTTADTPPTVDQTAGVCVYVYVHACVRAHVCVCA